MALGALDIIIAADTAQLRKGMDTAVGIMQSSTKTMENVAKTAATAIAGVFAFDGIKDSITQTLNLADSLSKMSQKVGVSVDALYAMQAAGKLADVSMESLEKGLLKFNKGLGTAQMGSGDTANALKNLGISLKDSSGHLRNSDQYLNEVADKFKSMPDGIAKSTLSMQLFGKSGADLIPLLNGGSESLKEFSGIMDANTGKAAERLNDSFTRMGLAFDGNKSQILTGMLPAIESLSKGLEDSSKWISENNLTIKELTHYTKEAGVVAGAYYGATLAVAGVRALKDIEIATKIATIAQINFNTVVKLNPWVLVAATIATAVGALYEYKSLLGDIADSQAKMAGNKAFMGDIKGLTGQSTDDKLAAVLKRSKEVFEEETKLNDAIFKGKKTILGGEVYMSENHEKFMKQTTAKRDALHQEQLSLVKLADSLKLIKSPPKAPSTSVDLTDFKGDEAKKESALKKAQADQERYAKEMLSLDQKYLGERENTWIKNFENEIKEQESNLDAKAEREAKAAIDQYNLDLFYIDDLASRQASYAVSLYDSITPDSEKIISKYTDIFETMKDMPVEMLKSFGDKMNEELANIKSGMDFSANIEFDPSMMDGVAKSIAGVSKSMMLLTKEEDQYQKNKSKYAEGSLEYAKNEENHTVKQIAGYANIAGAMSSMFEQGSKEAEAFKAIEAGLAIVSGAKAVVQAMTNGDPYTAIARGVAMAAMVASVLGSAGVSGGSSSTSTPAPATSMGTVLGGGAYGQSESMTNITDLLSSIHTSEYSQLRDINRAVTSMSENILSAVTNIFRSGVTDTSGVQLNSFDNAQERIDKTLAIIDKSFLNIGGIMSNAFMASGAGLFQALGFGGSSKQYIAGSGFNVAGGTVGDKASGNVGASTYVDVETASKNFWGSASYSHNITSTALDSASSQSIALIYRSFSDTMLSINKGLGTDLGDSISGYAVKAINISTAGLTGDEVVKKLNDTFSALGDTMANDVFGTVLSQYQKLGEGMLETAVRVITEKEVLLQDLANVNKTITGNVLDITQSLVDLSGGLTKFSDANSSYFDNYFSDAEKSAVYQKNLESAYKSMNITMPITIAGFRSTVDALDLNTASGRETYVSLMNIADAQKTYMDSLKDLTDLIPKPDMMLSKVTDTTNGGTDSLNTQLLVQVVKALNAIKTNNQFNAIGAII